MYINKLADAAASLITVTSTATGLYDLIDTAGASASDLKTKNLNAVDISVEDGDVRMLMDGNTPTGANGMLLSSGNTYYYRGVPLSKMKLIRVTANVACSVQVGKSESGENTSSSAHEVTLEAGDITIGNVDVNSPTTITGGAKTVTTAGTAETLGTTLATKSIYIRAKSANTNDVYIGDSAVDKTSNQQIILSANDSVTLDISDRVTVYVDATTNGEGVDYVCMS